ncbi:MAG: hypothetical protein WCO22_12780 [Betaproteobacteria bacterium]
MEIKVISKSIDKVRTALKALDQNKRSLADEFSLLTDAIEVLNTLDTKSVIDQLQQRLSNVKLLFEQQLANRRQTLEIAARDARLTHRRLSSVDKVGLFEVGYSNAKVTVKIGSENLTTFEEVDGKKLVERLTLEQKNLEESALPRDRFFKALKLAIALAGSDGKVQSGKTKVHDLFTYLVLTRQLVQSDVFRKKPIQKNFTEYSKAMMAFEFFKFGDHQDGWTFGSERLCNQGPNMATQSEALVLPDTGGSTTQILWLWVAQQ